MKLGLVCISEELKKSGISFQTMTRKKFLSQNRDKSLRELSLKILNNAKVTAQTIVYVGQNDIAHYRVSSSLFPLITDELLGVKKEDLPDYKEICAMLSLCGDLAKSHRVSLSSHPDQWNILGSYCDKVVEKTILELNHQSWVLDTIGCEKNYSSPMCLHVSKGPDTDKESEDEYVYRFMKNLSRCDEGVRNRLVLENEDKGFWNMENLVRLFCGTNTPFVFDNLHDSCLPSKVNFFGLMKSSWGRFTPVFHWSEGQPDSPRSHADFFSFIPDVVKNNPDVIWECEIKSKDIGIKQILGKP